VHTTNQHYNMTATNTNSVHSRFKLQITTTANNYTQRMEKCMSEVSTKSIHYTDQLV